VTPDQLAVERDALLQGGRTLEEVEAMQWVVSLGAEAETWNRLYRFCHAWRKATDGYDPCGDITAARNGLRHAKKRLLSAGENETGASAPRPSGETP